MLHHLPSHISKLILELFPMLHHEYLHGKLPQNLLIQTGYHQNSLHSHLRHPTPNTTWPKTNALYVHSNPGGATHRHLGLLMMNTKDATPSNVLYIYPVHPSILLIPNIVTCVASHKHKKVYNNNLWFFHKICGVKQYLIQQFSMAVEEKYITAKKNCITGQCTGNIRQILA